MDNSPQKKAVRRLQRNRIRVSPMRFGHRPGCQVPTPARLPRLAIGSRLSVKRLRPLAPGGETSYGYRGDVLAMLPGIRVRLETAGPPAWKGAMYEKLRFFVDARFQAHGFGLFDSWEKRRRS